jgi:hypothetical protein
MVLIVNQLKGKIMLLELGAVLIFSVVFFSIVAVFKSKDHVNKVLSYGAVACFVSRLVY